MKLICNMHSIVGNLRRKYIIDHQHGEWFWKEIKAGMPYADQEKAGILEMPVSQ
jgi:hypothetical protein